jgi:ferritin-like metal-binding protein YciE
MEAIDMSLQITRQAFITGLRDAHAMERKSQKWLERQAERTGCYREIQDHMMTHARETREQIRRIEKCLSELDRRPSMMKDLTMSMFGAVSDLADDMFLGAAIANAAFEHYEVAVYKSLIVLANDLDLSDSASRLQQSLEEEKRMAEWVDANVEELTRMRFPKDDQPAHERDRDHPYHRAA